MIFTFELNKTIDERKIGTKDNTHYTVTFKVRFYCTQDSYRLVVVCINVFRILCVLEYKVNVVCAFMYFCIVWL